MDENECLDVNELIEMKYVGVLILLIKFCTMFHSNFKNNSKSNKLVFYTFYLKK
jgi:hypothetical protein